MSVRVFVADGVAPQPGARIELDDDESRYLIKVRRVRVGEAIELLDGRGGVWTATLAAASRRAELVLGAAIERGHGLPERVVLLGLPDPAACLEALTHASELGATEVVLVGCTRSQGHAPTVARIERVLRAAMRQCGRPAPPIVRGGDAPWSLTAALAHRPQLAGLFGDATSRPRAPLTTSHLRLLVGPEGGLTAAEIEAARAAGFEALCLGPWVLRTPTAVAAMLGHTWPGVPAG